MTDSRKWNKIVGCIMASFMDSATKTELIDFVRGAEQLQSKWIPVTERLPEELENVLAYTDVGSFAETAHWTGHRWEKTWDFEVLYGVTHWMPLPEPPKEEQ